MASRMAVSKETSFKNKSQRSVESAFTAQNCTISPNQIRAFLLDLQEKGCVEGTLKKYGHDLTTFYHYLPKKKQVGPDTCWRGAGSWLPADMQPKPLTERFPLSIAFWNIWGAGNFSCKGS